MSRNNFYATTALGLCMVVAPLTASAQAAEQDGAGMFAPLVQECIANPTVDTCTSVRAVVMECAEDLERTACAVLFNDGEEVFGDPELLERAHRELQQTSDEIAQMSFPEQDGEAAELAEATRPEAERTLLRGDENLMSHSQPETLDGDPEEDEAVETQEPSGEQAVDDEPERVEGEASAPEAAAPADQAEAEAAEGEAGAERQAVEDDAEADAAAETEVEAGVEPQAEAEAQAQAVVEEATEADEAAEAERPEEAAAAEGEDPELEALAERLRQQAEEESEPVEDRPEAADDDEATEEAATDEEATREVMSEAAATEEAATEEDDTATGDGAAEESDVATEEVVTEEDDTAAGDTVAEEGDLPSEDAGSEEAVAEEAPEEATEAEDGRDDDSEEVTEEEREQLRDEAEAMAEDAPELIVEDAPEEEFVAPVETAPELTAEEQSAIDRLMEDPEVAAALSVLGGASAETDEAADEPVATEETDAAEEAETTEESETTEEAEAPRQEEPRARLAAVLAAMGRSGDDESDDEAAQSEEVIEDEITSDEVRSSREDFASRLLMDFDPQQSRRDDDRSEMRRAGLAALAGVAVGMMINRNRVVARSDERVVVDRGDGDLVIWRDDDTILQQEGSTRRIERYRDGSTLTRWERRDGSQVVTIRDATGRVVWRERILADGTSYELVDDTREFRPIDRSTLPPPRTRELRITQRTDPQLAIAMLQEAEADARALDRSFTLRQVRETREVRELVPVLSPDPITFETNRANVRADEAPKLMQVGRLLEQLIDENPREVFLVEGHTDATGSAAYNLGLSDRRAESVALALTEFFDIPPENLVIQGYGERHLRIPTLEAEERNRRVVIRRITPLLAL